MDTFLARRAIEHLRMGLSDPVAVNYLTMEEADVIQSFSRGLKDLEKGESRCLCICGSYGQGKSHNLNYLQQHALSQGYATSLVQLDPREVPFYRFSGVYHSLMKNLCLPTHERFATCWKNNFSDHEVLEGTPPRFRMILKAMISKNTLPPKNKKDKLTSKEIDECLEKALEGHDLPNSHLKRILKSRGVEEYQQPLTIRGNTPYAHMIQALGHLLHVMGFKGLVLFFDEAESIVQGRISSRVKSYEMLNGFFQHSGFVYPVFAFTETFFDQVRCEDYDSERSKYPQNYSILWKDLQIIRLEHSSLRHWETLQDRLITLYAEAYQLDIADQRVEIKDHMRDILEQLNMEETRFKIKALIHQLDIFCVRTPS